MCPGRASLTGAGAVPRRKLCVPTGALPERCFCPVSDPALTLLCPRSVPPGRPSGTLSTQSHRVALCVAKHKLVLSSLSKGRERVTPLAARGWVSFAAPGSQLCCVHMSVTNPKAKTLGDTQQGPPGLQAAGGGGWPRQALLSSCREGMWQGCPTLPEPVCRVGDDGGAALCCCSTVAELANAVVERDRALTRRCSWAGGLGCTSFLAMPVVPSQVTICPRPSHLPAEPRCEVSVTPVTQQAGTAFPQHLLSKTAEGAPAA